ncbi:DUF6479 family protein [Kitasatospora sp. NPDC018619]|uniref:DUF6479 family protein n=1 Tax=unclassified Kitasatospora TaxID=2633591 RepID=UPI0037A5BD64
MIDTPSLLAQTSSGPPLLVLIVPAVLIGAALIGAFVWGGRRRAARARPPEPVPRAAPAQEPDGRRPDPDSWRVAGTDEGPASTGTPGEYGQGNPGPPQ